MHNNYQQTLQEMYQRVQVLHKFDLRNMQALMHALGNPQQDLRCIVVAGTNGKGSTASMIAAALQHAGYHTGLYTSPHLLQFTERIRIAQQLISQQMVVQLFAAIKAVEHACPHQPTFFECATAMAILAFKQCGVERAVFEVGLGGRLDATNIVPRDMAVITPIGLDHQAYLGNSMAEIAAEKAGIIAADQPVVNAPQHAEAQQVIEAVAKQQQAPLYNVSVATWQYYQEINKATAKQACEVLALPAKCIQQAIEHLDWPGRLHWLEAAKPMLLDGAHNAAGMQALLTSIQHDKRCTGLRIHAVCSILRDKDAEAMLQQLQAHGIAVHLCPVQSKRSRSPEELSALQANHTYCSVHANMQEALAAAQLAADMVLVCGSLFLVADVLAYHTKLPRDPPIDA